MNELVQLLGPAVLETIVMVVVGTVLSFALGLPVGVALVLTGPGGVSPAPIAHRLVGAVVDVGRSVPFVIVMVAVVPLTRAVVGTSIGTAAAIVPLTIAALPFVARVVESALREVPVGVVESAVGMGASRWQLVRLVYLAEARPALVRAFTLTAVSLVSWSAMAGAVGGGGLGDLAVRYGYQRFRTDVMVATVVVLVVVVQGLQLGGERLARRFDHR